MRTHTWYLLAEAGDGSGEATLWILADDRASWATVEYTPDTTEFDVDRFGPANCGTRPPPPTSGGAVSAGLAGTATASTSGSTTPDTTLTAPSRSRAGRPL
ncbi:hypothetical protein [Streptomyces sp. NPDC054952]